MNENIYAKSYCCLADENRRLEKSNISQRNKDLIKQWQNYLFSTTSGEKRVQKVTLQMRVACQTFSKDLDKATKSDMETLITKINTQKCF